MQTGYEASQARELEARRNRLWAVRFILLSPIIIPAVLAITFQSMAWMATAWAALKIALGY